MAKMQKPKMGQRNPGVLPADFRNRLLRLPGWTPTLEKAWNSGGLRMAARHPIEGATASRNGAGQMGPGGWAGERAWVHGRQTWRDTEALPVSWQ